MATLSTSFPTLLDLARRTEPGGQIDKIVELLTQQNEVLDDMVWQEGNLPTGNRSTVRTGLPQPTWRKFYGGVQPTKSTTAQITDTTGMLEAYGEVDKALADLNGNTAAFRLSEDTPHIEGMNIEVASTLFYGNEATAPEKFGGLSPRYNSLSAANAENIIDAGGSGSDNASIWLVVWSPTTAFGIVPKGSRAGIQFEDKGQVTIENIDGNGGRMEAYRSHYRWDAGLVVRDWRYIVRICNIDKSDLTYDASSGQNLIQLMTRAEELVPNIRAGQPVFYVSRSIRTKLRTQMVASIKNSTLTMENVAGRPAMLFDGIPVRRVDALAADEARIT